MNGLSAGGSETWDFMFRYPKVVAGFLPISGCSIAFKDQVSVFKYIPLWIFQGGLDNNPHPGTTTEVVNADLAVGGNAKMTLYPNGGHGIWNTAWDEKDFWPFLNRQHKANPWPEFGHNEFCPGETVNVRLGLTAGFDGYEWRKDGVVIPGANSNTYVVTEYGTYDARIKKRHRLVSLVSHSRCSERKGAHTNAADHCFRPDEQCAPRNGRKELRDPEPAGRLYFLPLAESGRCHYTEHRAYFQRQHSRPVSCESNGTVRVLQRILRTVHRDPRQRSQSAGSGFRPDSHRHFQSGDHTGLDG